MRSSILLSLTAFLALCALPFASAVVYHDYYGSYGGDGWTSWEDDYLLNGKSHATPPFAPQSSFGGCYISNVEGQVLEDLDCDKAPDLMDNCVGISNPDQSDQNQNGIGDACDLLVDKILIDPSVVIEGRAFTTTAVITNYRPYDLRNLELTVQVPELGLEQKEYVDVIKAGEQGRYELYLRLPNCVRAKDYDVVLFLEWPRSPGVSENFYIPTKMGVQSSGMCQEEPTPAGKSIVNILDIQDIDPVKGGEYPFTIINNEPLSQAYVLTVEGTDGWGSYQIEPRSLLIVPAGESRSGLLTVFANAGASGEHGFLLTLRSKSDAKQMPLSARIKQAAPSASSRTFLQFGIFIVGAIILVAAFALALHHRKQQRHK